MSDFAEFVEKQQALRYPSAKPTTSATSTEHHEELDILDSLNLDDSEPHIPLRNLLLAPADDEASQERLIQYIDERLVEGHGEAVFDLGFELSCERELDFSTVW